MFIQTISTPKNDALKFIPGVEATTDGSAEIHDTRAALASLLAFRGPGIRAVFYGSDFVTATYDVG